MTTSQGKEYRVLFETERTMTSSTTIMSIIYIPQELQIREPVLCAICQGDLRFERATVGLFDANNCQQFACISHFSEEQSFIVGWADFAWTERTKYRQRQIEPNELLYGNTIYA